MEYSFFYIFQLFRLAISESNKSPSPLLWSRFQTEQQSKILLKYLLCETFEIFQSSDLLKFSRFVKRSLVTKTLSKRFAVRSKIVRGKLCYKYFQKVTMKLQFMFFNIGLPKNKTGSWLKDRRGRSAPYIQSCSLLSSRIIQ